MRVIALEYHDIVSPGMWEQSGFRGQAAATYKLDVDRFALHLDEVRDAGVKVANELPDTEMASTRVVLWTFDDGGLGYWTHAADRLEERGWRGIVFVTSGCIGTAGFLSAEHLRDLRQRGHVIGTHSRTHPARMSALTDRDISEEWRASVADLEDILGHSVRIGSVPGGFFSRRVARLAAAEGLSTLFTSEPVTRAALIDGCTVAGRFTLRRDHPASYVKQLVSPLPMARGLQWLQWNAKKAAKAAAGEAYGRLRNRVFGE